MGVDPHAIANMKRRVEQCRLLADFTANQLGAKILLQMAEEAEGELRRIGLDGRNELDQVVTQASAPPPRAYLRHYLVSAFQPDLPRWHFIHCEVSLCRGSAGVVSVFSHRGRSNFSSAHFEVGERDATVLLSC